MHEALAFTRHEGKVVEQGQFKHIMALALDEHSNYSHGVIRCIKSREGDLGVAGAVDHSELHELYCNTAFTFTIGEKIVIKNEDEVIASINHRHLEYLGPEDPDLFFEENTQLLHLYFTIPLIDRAEKHHEIHLGHAMGKDIHSLVMTAPVLLADAVGGAKELSMAPKNKEGVRLNLVESSIGEKDSTRYSTVRIARAHQVDGRWEFGDTLFHPGKQHRVWIAGHASPGPLLPKDFIDVGEGKLLGIMNGCEANEKIKGVTIFKDFSVGLFIYDYEKGVIDWVSDEPFIQDSVHSGRKITFASQFVPTKNGEGILYAHIDDSYIHAYTLHAEGIKKLIPKEYISFPAYTFEQEVQ